jgi:hypothetical protein
VKNFLRSDIAVSEAIGFILTLAIVIVSTSIVYVGGSTMLDKAEKNAHFQGMEKAFIFMGQNIDKVGFDRAPVRNTELKIKGGAIAVFQNSNITIGDQLFNLGSVEYIYDDKSIAYENGGIWIKYPGSEEVVMAAKPTFAMGNVTTIPVMELYGYSYLAGDGNLRVNSIGLPSELVPITGGVNGTYSIVIKSSYYKGWRDYLTDIGAWDFNEDPANMTMTANITANRVNVDHHVIMIKILED